MMTEKSITSLYLSDENRDWMKQHKLNMSAFVDALVTRAREAAQHSPVLEEAGKSG